MTSLAYLPFRTALTIQLQGQVEQGLRLRGQEAVQVLVSTRVGLG